MGKLRVYWLKTLKKLSIYPLGNTPSAPSVNHKLGDRPTQSDKSVDTAAAPLGEFDLLENAAEVSAPTRYS